MHLRLLVLTFLLTPFTSLIADTTEAVFFRIKGGMGFYSNLNPISSAPVIGMDVGYRAPNGLGVTGTSRFFLSQSEVSANISTEASVKLFALTPTYSITKGKACITLGLGIGGALVSIGSGTVGVGQFLTTVSEFVLAPSMDADFVITDSFAFNAGIQFIKSLGSQPNLAIIAPTIGAALMF